MTSTTQTADTPNKSYTESNRLGEIIRRLLKLRGLRAFDLSERIGITPTSLSKIMNGSTRPRQTTFTRMCQNLCDSEDEKNELVNAYAHTELVTKEDNETAPRSSDQEINRLRAEQFLERKTQSIQFKRSVARELDRANIQYTQDYCEGIISTDFLVSVNGNRVALECKTNVGRDIERTESMRELIGRTLDCPVALVIPYDDNTAPDAISLGQLSLKLVQGIEKS